MNARFEPGVRLRGRLAPPADKSISHRAAIVGAMASAPVRIANYLDAADTRSTLEAIASLGATVERRNGDVVVRGRGLRNARTPDGAIDVGNAGTLMRLLPGWLAFQQEASFTLDGDESIRRRPVDRIAEPLSRMGARIEARDGRYAPFTVHGAALSGMRYELPVASAQVKSCVLLAGLATERTSVIEPVATRDHTERMLRSAPGPRSPAKALCQRRHPRRRSATRRRARARAGCDSGGPVERGLSDRGGGAGAGVAIGARPRRGQLDAHGLYPGSCSGWGRPSSVTSSHRARSRRTSPSATWTSRSGTLQATTVDGDEVPLAIDKRAAAGRARRVLRRGRDGRAWSRRAATAPQGVRDRIATVVDGLRGLGA